MPDTEVPINTTVLNALLENNHYFLHLGPRFVRLELEGKHNPVPLLSCFRKQLKPRLHFGTKLSTFFTFTSERKLLGVFIKLFFCKLRKLSSIPRHLIYT